MAAWIWSLAALGFIVVGCAVLLFSAHLPWLRKVTGAGPLEAEAATPEPEPETAAVVDQNYRSAQAARRARTASDLPHGSARRGTHL
jgi:hypothetical protein